jgi:hypothetical protein
MTRDPSSAAAAELAAACAGGGAVEVVRGDVTESDAADGAGGEATNLRNAMRGCTQAGRASLPHPFTLFESQSHAFSKF